MKSNDQSRERIYTTNFHLKSIDQDGRTTWTAADDRAVGDSPYQQLTLQRMAGVTSYRLGGLHERIPADPAAVADAYARLQEGSIPMFFTDEQPAAPPVTYELPFQAPAASGRPWRAAEPNQFSVHRSSDPDVPDSGLPRKRATANGDASDATAVLLAELVEQVQQLAIRQDMLASAVSEQRQVFDSYLTQVPPQLPMNGPPLMLPPGLPGLPGSPGPPGTSIQPSSFGFPVPYGGAMVPGQSFPLRPDLPMVHRDIRRVVMNHYDGSQTPLVSHEVTTIFDPLQNTETHEDLLNRYTNRGGEPLDHSEPLYACCYCGDLTNHPQRCSVCGRPLCQRHVLAVTIDPSPDAHPEIRCNDHFPWPPMGLLGFILGLFG